jgi:hypothetical protein
VCCGKAALNVLSADAAHDFVLEVPAEAHLFVLLPPFLNAVGQTNIPPTEHRCRSDGPARRASVSVAGPLSHWGEGNIAKVLRGQHSQVIHWFVNRTARHLPSTFSSTTVAPE